MDECLMRLHIAIKDLESNKSSSIESTKAIKKLEHAFKYFDEQMIKVYEDSTESQSEKETDTWVILLLFHADSNDFFSLSFF